MMGGLNTAFDAVQGGVGKAEESFGVANHGKGVDSELRGAQEAAQGGPMSAIKGLGSGVQSILPLLTGSSSGGSVASIAGVLGSASGLGKV